MRTCFCSALPLLMSSKVWGQSWHRVIFWRAQVTDGICSHCHSSKTRYESCRSRDWRGREAEEEGHEEVELQPSHFASVPSSQGSFILSPLAHTSLTQELLQQQLPNLQLPSWIRKFLNPFFCQFLEESAPETDTWKNHLKKIAPPRKDTERWKLKHWAFSHH